MSESKTVKVELSEREAKLAQLGLAIVLEIYGIGGGTVVMQVVKQRPELNHLNKTLLASFGLLLHTRNPDELRELMQGSLEEINRKMHTALGEVATLGLRLSDAALEVTEDEEMKEAVKKMREVERARLSKLS